NANNNAASGVTAQDVQAAIGRSIAKYRTYNNDQGAVNACKSAGAGAGWTQTMQDYYCVFPGTGPDIRMCFTSSVRGDSGYTKRSYPEAYDYCANTHTGTPMAWIKQDQDAVFR